VHSQYYTVHYIEGALQHMFGCSAGDRDVIQFQPLMFRNYNATCGSCTSNCCRSLELWQHLNVHEPHVVIVLCFRIPQAKHIDNNAPGFKGLFLGSSSTTSTCDSTVVKVQGSQSNACAYSLNLFVAYSKAYLYICHQAAPSTDHSGT
jgi:hypothetical protein